MPLVFDTQNPAKHAFEVSEQWVTIMSQKEPGRYKVKSAPQVVHIPKKKVVVVGKKDFAERMENKDFQKFREQKFLENPPRKFNDSQVKQIEELMGDARPKNSGIPESEKSRRARIKNYEITKENVSLNPIKVDAPFKKRPIKVSAPSKKRN